MRRAISTLTLSALLTLGAGGGARADTLVEYLGPHPIDPGLATGMCYITGPHVHAYAPTNPVLYTHVDGGWAFIGDPVEFEPVTPRYGYYGHHPIFWVDGPELYCYISGPHYHLEAPPPGAGFKQKGSVYWYVGEQPSWYKQRVNNDLDQHYAAVHIVHPVVTATPPVGFVGVVVGLPSVTIGVPGVIIAPAAPVFVPVVEEHEGHHHGHGWEHRKGHGHREWED